jgi:quercetin dioxygenase-like cupin family protein
MEGKVGYQIEGYPYFEAEPGDIVTAQKGRWHRPSNAPDAPMSTRIPFNPRPVILHNFATD